MTDDKDLFAREGESLLALHAKSQWLTQRLIESGGEMDEQLEAFFTELADKKTHKAEAYHHMLEHLKFEEDFFKAEGNKYLMVAKSIRTAQERMKATLKYVMEKQGIKEISGRTCRMVLTNAKPALDIDEQKIPDAFKQQVVTYEIDKQRIRVELEAGNEIEGARLIPVFTLRTYMGSKK